MELTDEEIIASVCKGATEEYALLVKKYERTIYNLMYRFTGNEQEAADLTQEVFVQSFSKLHTLDLEKGYFSWLYTIAMNKGKDWNRALRNRACHTVWTEEHHYKEKNTFHDLSIQEHTMQKQQDFELLHNALMSLPHAIREILLLRYKYERPINEIAGIFSLSESATKMRIKRSLEQLQKILQDTSIRL